jgi:hypothetical protein
VLPRTGLVCQIPTKRFFFAEVGEGGLDWPAILAAFQEAGVEWHKPAT